MPSAKRSRKRARKQDKQVWFVVAPSGARRKTTATGTYKQIGKQRRTPKNTKGSTRRSFF